MSELNRQAKRLLEGHFNQVWVSGELSNFARPQSGHWYFSLKDSKAQLRCAMFRNRNSLLRFKPSEGDAVIARGRISLYEGRGDFQLIVDNLQPAGAGALQLQLDQLKAQLQQQGLFDADVKQALPAQPAHVVVISSASGAALQDILSVFQRRAPQVLISVMPVAVQGKESAAQLTTAVRSVSDQAAAVATPLSRPIDAVILARGGGSLEDLWSFNDVDLAQAIYACDIPVVSAVGHETDFTICDMVADVRAPTPSAAAELLSPDSHELKRSLSQVSSRLIRISELRLQNAARDLQQTRRLLRHPGHRLEELSQRCDELSERLQRSARETSRNQGASIRQLYGRLLAQTPAHQLAILRAGLNARSRRLQPAAEAHLEQARVNVGHQVSLLQAVSPLATLERGYSIVEKVTADGKSQILRSAKDTQAGDLVQARLASGTINATVTKTS